MSEAADATGTVETFPSPQDERTVMWGEAQFTINKMLPMEAKAVFVEHVQPLMHQSHAAAGRDGERRRRRG